MITDQETIDTRIRAEMVILPSIVAFSKAKVRALARMGWNGSMIDRSLVEKV
jgi:hypothetical protein